MANFNGATLRYNNSDIDNRQYDLNSEVELNDNQVTAIRSITAQKGQTVVGYGAISDLNTDVQRSSFNITGPLSEHVAIFTAMHDFARQAQAKAEENNFNEA